MRGISFGPAHVLASGASSSGQQRGQFVMGASGWQEAQSEQASDKRGARFDL